MRVFPGSDGPLQDWKKVSPRVGLSYALDESRRTIVRASYARYYSDSFRSPTWDARTRRRPASSRTAGRTRTATASCSPARSNLNEPAVLERRRPGEPRLGLGRHRSTRSTATGGRARTTSSIRRPRPRAGPELRGRRGVHLSAAARLVECHVSLEGRVRRPARAHRGQLPAHGRLGLHAECPGHGERLHRIQLLADRGARHGGPRRQLADEPRGLLDELHGPGADARQAAVQQVDGPRGVQPLGLDADTSSMRSAPMATPRGGKATTSWTPTRWLSRAAPWARARTSWAARSGSSTATRSTSSRGASTSRARSGPARRLEAHLPQPSGRQRRHVGQSRPMPASRTSATTTCGTSTSRLAETFRFGKQAYVTLSGGVVQRGERGHASCSGSARPTAAAYNRIDQVLHPSIIRLGATFGF